MANTGPLMRILQNKLFWAELLALFFICGCRNFMDEPIEFSTRSPGSEEVARALTQDQKDLADYNPNTQAQEILARLYHFNTLSISPLLSGQEIEVVLAELRASFRELLEGPDGKQILRRLNLWLLARFEKELQSLIEARLPGLANAIKSGTPPTTEALSPYIRFIEVGGDFLPVAFQNGLIIKASDGEMTLAPDATFFIRLAFKVRFANLMPETSQPLNWLLNDFERHWYNIWVVERSKTAALDRQLEAIDALKRLEPNYQETLARGIVMFRHNNYSDAVKAFEAALRERPDDSRCKNLLQKSRSYLH